MKHGLDVPSGFQREWLDGRISFTVGTGRCGTTFLYRLLDKERDVAASHERNPLAETFHRYTIWNGLPVDDEGFLETKAEEIECDLKNHRFSAEVSAYLAFSVTALHTRFGGRFVLLIRHPEDVIRSYLRKGWYDRSIAYRDRSQVPGFQSCEHFHHFLGRPIPSGDEFQSWNQLTRAGKLAWFWSTVNRMVAKQFESLPRRKTHIQKLETLDYHSYLDLTDFLGIESQVTRREFQRIQKARPNRSRGGRGEREVWSELEREEISQQAGETATIFGYSL